MALQIKPASRVGICPLIAFYSESGCGKTYSSLLLARGIAGDKGVIVVGDSESGRASLYADVLQGGFSVVDIESPFTPQKYIEVLDAIEASGAAVAVLDSGSHEWEGVGGVLDMAAENEQRSGKAGLHNWKQPKFEHAKFVQRLMRSKIPVIICLRAKYKSRQTKENGKTVIVKDETTSPIQAEDFIFEATCHAEILPNHSIVLTKCSHPALKKCFPADKTTPITIEHGRLLGEWCRSGGAPAPSGASAANPATTTGTKKSDPLAEAKKELWSLMSTRLPEGYTVDTINQMLWKAELLDAADPDARVEKLTLGKLTTLIEKIKTLPA